MDARLTPGQRAQLQQLLELRQHELDRRVAAHLGATGRPGCARETLQQDGDDAPQRGKRPANAGGQFSMTPPIKRLASDAAATP
jgi:hypothetical protein